jgi:hypothetical protein
MNGTTDEEIEDEAYIEAASRKYVKGHEPDHMIQSQSLPFDEDVVDRVANGGAWVLAWVWITREEAEEVRDGGG